MKPASSDGTKMKQELSSLPVHEKHFNDPGNEFRKLDDGEIIATTPHSNVVSATDRDNTGNDMSFS